MTDLEQLRHLARRFATQSSETAIPELYIGRLPKAPEPIPMLYEPMVCLVLSGGKQVYAGRDVFEYGEGQHFVSAVNMPVTVRIHVNANDREYVALVLRLDPKAVAELLTWESTPAAARKHANFGVADSDAALLDAWRRLCELLDRPDEISFLAPLIVKEITWRLLRGPHEGVLAQLAVADPRVLQIRSTAAWLRANYSEPVTVEQLAQRAGMSLTVFHRHFKEIMAISPLQYQKSIRLHEARSRLGVIHRDAKSAAYAVGYESASQFSREYKRLFGVPPSAHIADRRRVS